MSMDSLNGKLEEKLRETLGNVNWRQVVFDASALQVWKEYISSCLKHRAMLGENIAVDTEVRMTPPLELCMKDYESICTSTLKKGKTIILYGGKGSGKTYSLATLLRGDHAWAPHRGIYMSARGVFVSGNEFMAELTSVIKYNGER
jgi:hypothetical protein